MLVSGIQQSDSVIRIHVSILFQVLLPFRLLQNIEQSSLCYTVGPYFQLLVSLIFFYCFLVSISFISALIFMLSFLLSILGIYSSFSSSFRCKFRLFI